jgi:hypothetical protein
VAMYKDQQTRGIDQKGADEGELVDMDCESEMAEEDSSDSTNEE